MDDMSRNFGRMEAQIAALTKSVEQLTTRVEAIDKTLAEAKGGWRVLMLIGGAGSIIGAIATKLAEWVHISAS